MDVRGRPNKLPCLDMALAEGRKYGACIVLGFQNMAQIQGIYGAQGSKSLSELMVNKFLFQAVDFDNAKMLAHFFGDKQILESHENVSFGANEIRDGVSLTHRKKLEPIIRASHLMELKPLHFYARIAAQKCCLKGDLSYFESLTQAESFIPSSSMDDRIEKVIGEKYKNIPIDKIEKEIVKVSQITTPPKEIEDVKKEPQLENDSEFQILG